ncbi:MAG: hypothetical protein ACR2PQ_03355 [Myxococcota bacterium]
MQMQPPRMLEPPCTPAAAAALESEIDQCGSRDHVVRLAVHLARAYAESAAIFCVRHDLIEGVVGEGFDAHVAATVIPVDADSLFGRVAATGKMYRGSPPAEGLGLRLLAALGRDQVREIAILPVTIRGRVVTMLYADNGPEVLGDAAIAALGAVCIRISRSYARLILQRKASEVRREAPAPLGSLLRG